MDQYFLSTRSDPGIFNPELLEGDFTLEEIPNSNPFAFLLFMYGGANGMCWGSDAFWSGFVVVGTEGQTATNPNSRQAFLCGNL